MFEQFRRIDRDGIEDSVILDLAGFFLSRQCHVSIESSGFNVFSDLNRKRIHVFLGQDFVDSLFSNSLLDISEEDVLVVEKLEQFSLHNN